jgi:nitrite reductase/ring-hydroxylating ferredoxin subunit
MTTESGHSTPLARGWQWLSSLGLAIPLSVGAALVVLVLITLASDMYDAPHTVRAGNEVDFVIGAPRQFADDEFWLMNLGDGEFVAVYDRDPVSGCALVWGPQHQFAGKTGWFRDACTGSTYDLTGGCFDGPCEIGLNRLGVAVEDGELIVDPRGGTRGILRTENGDPVNPPQ